MQFIFTLFNNCIMVSDFGGIFSHLIRVFIGLFGGSDLLDGFESVLDGGLVFGMEEEVVFLLGVLGL